MIALALLPPAAHADTIAAWSYTFAEAPAVSGSDGWSAGYDGDPWAATEDGGVVAATPRTDVGSEQARGDWGEGGALDNWLVNEAAPVSDGVFSATVHATDDDSFGLVIGQINADYLYLFVLCGASDGDNPDCPLDIKGDTGSAIVKLTDGDAEILASDLHSYSQGDRGEMTFGINDGVLTATFEAGDVALEVEDADATQVDAVGFWAYNMGLSDEGQDSAYFSEPVLAWYDDDGDGVADDDDNCETTANADQADGDGDGIGTACDEDEPGGGDTGTNIAPGDTGPADTGGGGGGGGRGGGAARGNGDITSPGACNCATAPGSAYVLASVAFAGLVSIRRRRGPR
jgi:MYXO-CTERM domain-containing protein